MQALLDVARPLDLNVALNALLGAYLNLAEQNGLGEWAASALSKTGELIMAQKRSAAASASGSADPAEAARALASRINAVVQGERHDLVLTALLALFEQGAAGNRCCVDVSAQAATAVGKKLSELAASTGHSAAVH